MNTEKQLLLDVENTIITFDSLGQHTIVCGSMLGSIAGGVGTDTPYLNSICGDANPGCPNIYCDTPASTAIDVYCITDGDHRYVAPNTTNAICFGEFPDSMNTVCGKYSSLRI